MKKKVVMLVMVLAMILLAAGAVSAATSPGKVIKMQLDTTLTLTCQGGYMDAVVDNNNQPTLVHVTCYSFLPPVQGEQR